MFTGIVERTVRVIGAVAGPKFNRLTLAVDWSDVRDIVRGYWLALEHCRPGEAYNIGSDHAMAVGEQPGDKEDWQADGGNGVHGQ